MCGRYYVEDDIETKVRRILQDPAADDGALTDITLTGAGTHDVCPSETALLITADGRDHLACREMTWGFPNPAGKGLLINARAETVHEKRMFRAGIRGRRCVIPAAGFYEWDRDGNRATFTLHGRRPVWLAGFYDLYDNAQRFIILTTVANDSMKPVHDRMPCFLAPERIRDWILHDEQTDAFLSEEMPALQRYQEYEQQSLFGD